MNVLEVHLLSNQKKYFFLMVSAYFGIVAPDQQHAQSRSPSMRSSGRNVRLWDNPLPEARNPG